jgi:hypothetical protein
MDGARVRTTPRTTVVLTVVLLTMAATLLGTPASADGHLTVVADGLDNPRGIDVGPAGRLYVAEAGRGGDTLVQTPLGPTDGPICVGLTGSITELHRGEQRSLISLPSLSEAVEGSCAGTGVAAAGPHDVALGGVGQLSIVIGLGGDPATRDTIADAFPAASLFSTAHRILPNGRNQLLGDLAAFEAANNPDGNVPDTNPYGIAIDGGSRLVADAGGNSLIRLAANGRSSVVAVFAPQCIPWTAPFPNPIPNVCGGPESFPAESVPTDVVVGPDGAYYVSELTGFPFTPEMSRVWRVDPGRSTPATCSTFAFVPNDGCEVYASGLTSVVDLGFASDGTLYAVQFADAGVLGAEVFGDFDGSVQAIPPGGGVPSPAVTGLTVPGGIAVDGDHLYITNNSIFPGSGQVVRASR